MMESLRFAFVAVLALCLFAFGCGTEPQQQPKGDPGSAVVQSAAVTNVPESNAPLPEKESEKKDRAQQLLDELTGGKESWATAVKTVTPQEQACQMYQRAQAGEGAVRLIGEMQGVAFSQPLADVKALNHDAHIQAAKELYGMLQTIPSIPEEAWCEHGEARFMLDDPIDVMDHIVRVLDAEKLTSQDVGFSPTELHQAAFKVLSRGLPSMKKDLGVEGDKSYLAARWFGAAHDAGFSWEELGLNAEQVEIATRLNNQH